MTSRHDIVNLPPVTDELGIESEDSEIEDDDFDVLKFVLSSNLHGRHLTESQRGLVAARVEGLFTPKAKERQKASGGDRKSDNAKSVPLNLGEPIPEPSNGDKHATESASQAGQMLNVSRSTVDHARTVIQHGSQDLIAAVERGEVAVSKAAAVAKATPKREQLQQATKVKEKTKKKTPLQQLQYWWEKADEAAQRKFQAWIE